MQITKREELLMRRALDPASSPAEAAKAAEAFVNSLRKRGINGYEFARPTAAPQPSPQSEPPKSDFSSAFPDFDSAFDFKAERPNVAPQPEPPPEADDPNANGFAIFMRVIGFIFFLAGGMPATTQKQLGIFLTLRLASSRRPQRLRRSRSPVPRLFSPLWLSPQLRQLMYAE